MGYLNPETYEKLYKKVLASGDKEDMKLVRDETNKCIHYVELVCYKENELNTTADPSREMIGDYDSKRHHAHEDVIVTASLMNRFAAQKGIGPIYTGDPNERHQVAAFCLELAGWLFENRRRVL